MFPFLRKNLCMCTVKKVIIVFPIPSRMSLTKLFLVGKRENYSLFYSAWRFYSNLARFRYTRNTHSYIRDFVLCLVRTWQLCPKTQNGKKLKKLKLSIHLYVNVCRDNVSIFLTGIVKNVLFKHYAMLTLLLFLSCTLLHYANFFLALYVFNDQSTYF